MSSSKEDCLKDCGLCQSTLFYDEVSSSTQEDTQALEDTRALEDTNDDANEEFNTLSYTSSSSCMMTPFCCSKENLDLIPNIVVSLVHVFSCGYICRVCLTFSRIVQM